MQFAITEQNSLVPRPPSEKSRKGLATRMPRPRGIQSVTQSCVNVYTRGDNWSCAPLNSCMYRSVEVLWLSKVCTYIDTQLYQQQADYTSVHYDAQNNTLASAILKLLTSVLATPVVFRAALIPCVWVCGWTTLSIGKGTAAIHFVGSHGIHGTASLPFRTAGTVIAALSILQWTAFVSKAAISTASVILGTYCGIIRTTHSTRGRHIKNIYCIFEVFRWLLANYAERFDCTFN